MNGTESPPYQFLDWDTNFFGFRIGRANTNRLDSTGLALLHQWQRENQIRCLYFLANADDRDTIALVEQEGFHLVEVRLIFERSLKDWQPQSRPVAAEGIVIRPAQTADVPALQEIAKNSYIDSRFYFDRRFPESKWQEYYAFWVKKSCEGGAELALVAEMNGEIVGYITGQVDRVKGEAMYELTGVKESARRLGVGQALFRSGLDWYFQQGISYVWLATQGRNVATQRMVQRNGFITRACQLYYHKWFN